MSAKESAKETAIRDIKEYLKQNHKSFIAFHKVLNPIMDKIIDKQLKEQCAL